MLAAEHSPKTGIKRETSPGFSCDSPQLSLRPSPTLKVVLLGDLGVGKTCLRSQFVHHVFLNAYKATIGGDYLTTAVEIGQEVDGASRDLHGKHISGPNSSSSPVSLQVWDTAGQERFNLILQAFYRGADVAVLVYDITSYESLLSIKDWFSRFMEHCHVEMPGIVIVGNKSDRSAERAIDFDEVEHVICRHDAGGKSGLSCHVTSWDDDVFEISCRNLASVQAVFRRVAELGIEKTKRDNSDRVSGARSVVLDNVQTSNRCAC